jgi:hypothetical protein
MRFALIGPAYSIIPPKGWGAVEIIIWEYYKGLTKLGHKVKIINGHHDTFIKEIQEFKPDIVHMMYDDYVSILPLISSIAPLVLYTTHYAYLCSSFLKNTNDGYYISKIKPLVNCFNCKNVYIFALSEDIKNMYKIFGFPEERIIVQKNGASSTDFKYSKVPLYKNRSVSIGKIEKRKRQYIIQKVSSIDFAGQFKNSNFNLQADNYKGHWEKPILYESLTNYTNLVHVSDGEADPLVIKEAIISGLGVVLSEVSCANLDTALPWVDVIPETRINDIDYIQDIVEKNRVTSIIYREEIREYGLINYSWNVIMNEYLEKVNKIF